MISGTVVPAFEREQQPHFVAGKLSVIMAARHVSRAAIRMLPKAFGANPVP